MTHVRRRITLGGLLALVTGLGPAWAADYPVRPIELVVPSSAGGGTDVMARNFADAARKYLPQPFVVNNKPGVSGGLGMGRCSARRPTATRLRC
jgi:tripartite-type tricarboxylate transporter receptor subunit TctC